MHPPHSQQNVANAGRNCHRNRPLSDVGEVRSDKRKQQPLDVDEEGMQKIEPMFRPVQNVLAHTGYFDPVQKSGGLGFRCSDRTN